MEQVAIIIKIKVKPNSSKQEVIKEDGGYIVHLKSRPENNKANLELVKLLKKHFGKTVTIKSGLTSRNKTAEVKN
ncbi:MAG: DUF167 domain-containing protein [Nanoarchaeota archaeon]